MAEKLCSSCHLSIRDPYMMQMGSEFWHEMCLTCQACRVVLKDSCFKRDSKILCKTDYERLYGIKCSVCNQLVPPRELVMRVLGNIYHLRCFLCSLCGRSLQKGEQFIIRNGRIICSLDFESEPMSFQQCVAFSSVLSCMDKLNGADENILLISHPHTASDTSRRGPKRPRTILTSHQRRAFKSSFEISPKPCRKVRESLAKDLGLSVRVVQVWFQNQRAKIKKLQRRQQQVQQQPKPGSSGTEKDDSDIDDDSMSAISSLDLDDLKSNPDSEKSVSRETKDHKVCKPQKNATKKSRTAKKSTFAGNENLTDSKRSLRKSAMANMDSLTSLAALSPCAVLEDATDTDVLKALQHRTAFDCGPSNGKGLDINPIDSLYSMHSSYFNSE